jgi:hypothetical protein
MQGVTGLDRKLSTRTPKVKESENAAAEYDPFTIKGNRGKERETNP